jgi:hypothetical protein
MLQATQFTVHLYGGYEHLSWLQGTYAGVVRTSFGGTILERCSHHHPTPADAMTCANATITRKYEGEVR